VGRGIISMTSWGGSSTSAVKLRINRCITSSEFSKPVSIQTSSGLAKTQRWSGLVGLHCRRGTNIWWLRRPCPMATKDWKIEMGRRVS
jgi:hypothetical protein